MRRWWALAACCLVVMADASRAGQNASPARPAPASADPIKAASDALGVSLLKTIRFTGFGANFSVGQSPNPNEPWPPVTIESYEVHRVANNSHNDGFLIDE